MRRSICRRKRPRRAAPPAPASNGSSSSKARAAKSATGAAPTRCSSIDSALPVAREHRVNAKIDEPIAEPFTVALDAFELEAEAFGNRAAAAVLARGEDRDAVHVEAGERV